MEQDLSKIDTVLLDIGTSPEDDKGTTATLYQANDSDQQKEPYFPYAIKALPDVLQHKWNDPEFTQYRDAFPEEFRTSPETLEAHVQDLTTRDVKIAYLKNLQGYLWHTGYTTGAYTTPIFPDVLPNLESWSSPPAPLTLAIYSSGSIQAQHLLFTYIQSPSPISTKPIDARSLITSWFDTTNAGPKTSSSSYELIAKSLSKDVEKVLFLSDSVSEVEAALKAGMKACVVVRKGNKELSEDERKRHHVVYGLGDLRIR